MPRKPTKNPAAVSLGSKGGKARAKLLKAGKLPASANGGRPAIEKACERCGTLCPSARAAQKHKCKAK